MTYRGAVTDVATAAPLRAALKAALASGAWVGLDVESDGPSIVHPRKPKVSKPDVLRHRLVGYGVAVGGDSWYVPLRHDSQITNFSVVAPGYFNTANPEGWKVLRFVRLSGNVVMHNANFDVGVLGNEGFEVGGPVYDSMVLAWMAGWRLVGSGGLKLKALMSVRYGQRRPDFSAVLGDRKRIAECGIDEVGVYCAQDASDALTIATDTWAALSADERHVYETIERPCLAVTRHMCATGTALETPGLVAGAAFAKTEMDRLSSAFATLTTTTVMLPSRVKQPRLCEYCRACAPSKPYCTVPGCVSGVLHYKNGKPRTEMVEVLAPVVRGADIASSAQVSRWLFDELRWWPKHGHPVTKGKQLSTSAADIKPLCALPGDAGEAARLRMQYQALSKYADLYTTTLVEMAAQWGDGRLHTDYKQTGTDTSRYSSSFPNISNLPRVPKAEGVPDIRAHFVARPGWRIVQRDYSQGELRLAAHYSGDPSMLRIYREAGDIHAETMSAVGVDRHDAKTLNFSTLYDISAPSLAAKIAFGTGKPCSTREAQERLDGWLAKYHRIPVYQDAAERFARANGYAKNLYGFRMRLTDWSRKTAGYSRRRAINYPIQGTLGGMMKQALVRCFAKWTREGVLGERVVVQGQTYDSMYVEAREDFVEQAAEDMRVIMESVIVLKVPVTTDLKIGGSWA